MGHVQHRAVLDVGAGADANAMHVAAGYRLEPEGAVVTGLDVARHHRPGSDEDPLAQARPHLVVGGEGQGPTALAC